MFKFPENFPVLKEPYLIIATPVWFQLFLLIILFLISTFVIFWFSINVDSLQLKHYLALAFSIFILYGIFHKSTWERWYGFIADSNGVYLGNTNRLLIFIPWENVGETYVIRNSTYGARVIIKIKIDDYSWNKIPSEHSAKTTHPSQYLNVANDGYRHIVIDNYILSTKYKLKKIASLRQHSELMS